MFRVMELQQQVNDAADVEKALKEQLDIKEQEIEVLTRVV